MAGLFGPTVAEIQQSINERGKAEDLQRASLPRGRGPVLAGASFGRNLGQMLFGQPNNPDLQKARGLQEVEESVRQTVAENDIQDPSLILEISKKMLLERGFIQEALMVHQKSVEANKAQLEQRRAEADASRAEVGARVAEGTEQSQIETGNLAPEVAQQQLDTSRQQQATSAATEGLRQVQTETAQFELEQLRKVQADPNIDALKDLKTTIKGFPTNTQILLIAQRARTDPAVRAAIGGEIGLQTLEKIIDDLNAGERISISRRKLQLLEKKHMGPGLSKKEEALLKDLQQTETLLDRLLDQRGGFFEGAGATPDDEIIDLAE